MLASVRNAEHACERRCRRGGVSSTVRSCGIQVRDGCGRMSLVQVHHTTRDRRQEQREHNSAPVAVPWRGSSTRWAAPTTGKRTCLNAESDVHVRCESMMK
eukprot:6194324-Pleurochrysis_carterae.AAC.7